MLIGVWQAEVREDVAAAFGGFDFVFHSRFRI
jgi:hypothetical protein